MFLSYFPQEGESWEYSTTPITDLKEDSGQKEIICKQASEVTKKIQKCFHDKRYKTEMQFKNRK